jgi:hypothetical protein
MADRDSMLMLKWALRRSDRGGPWLGAIRRSAERASGESPQAVSTFFQK